jgi:hypothetical protein
LAFHVRSCGLRGHPIYRLGEIVRVRNPWDLEELVEGVANYAAAHVGDKALRDYEHATCVPDKVILWLYRRPQGDVTRRSELMRWWMRIKGARKAADGRRFVQWLLADRASEVFRLLAPKHRLELTEFVDQFLRTTARTVDRCLQLPSEASWYGDYGAQMAVLALEIRGAAIANGLHLPTGTNLPETAKYHELIRRRKENRAATAVA